MSRKDAKEGFQGRTRERKKTVMPGRKKACRDRREGSRREGRKEGRKEGRNEGRKDHRKGVKEGLKKTLGRKTEEGHTVGREEGTHSISWHKENEKASAPLRSPLSLSCKDVSSQTCW
jgi:hypothetical protein